MTAAVLQQHATWGRCKAWIRLKKRVYNDIEMSTTQRASLAPSSHEAASPALTPNVKQHFHSHRSKIGKISLSVAGGDRVGTCSHSLSFGPTLAWPKDGVEGTAGP